MQSSTNAVKGNAAFAFQRRSFSNLDNGSATTTGVRIATGSCFTPLHCSGSNKAMGAKLARSENGIQGVMSFSSVRSQASSGGQGYSERDDEAKPVNTSSAESQKSFVDKFDPYASQKHQQLVARVGLDAMKRANSTLEDFSRSYFMFHQLEISQPQSIFRYLPVLSFTESYIYQIDVLNEKIVSESASGSQVTCSSRGWKNAESRVLFETDPLKPLADVLEREGLLTQRIQQELNSGKEYWALESKLCHALSNKNKICLEDVMRAISFDYRVLSLLLYKLRGQEDDVLENHFNVLRMFVGIFGPSNAPTELAKQISEAEEKYEELLKSLDPHLSSSYKRRCEGATKEVYGFSLGTWNIPAVISDEEAYRTAQR